MKKEFKKSKIKYHLKVKNGREVVNEVNYDANVIDVYGSGGVFKYTDDKIFTGPSVLFGRKGTIGKPLYVDGDFWTVDTMYYTNIYKENSPRYFYYLFKIFPWSQIVTQTALPSIVGTEVENFEFNIPSHEIQNKIAEYLDYKCDEIDKLLKQKEELIILLEQQRQSIISEAVTKGLNPKVKMKDSNVAWIGQIPEHWEIRKIKEVANVYSSNIDKKSVENEKEVLLCNYVDVYYNDSITSNIEFMRATAKDEQIKTFTLKKQDVIITKDSESSTDIAIPTWVSQDLDGVVCGYHLSLIRCLRYALGHYLYYSLESVQLREQFYIRANGVTRYGLSKEAIKNGLIALPPMNEQLEIAEKLYKVNQEIRSTIQKINVQIAKLKEYRQSLIYEAVTGKIDLCDIQLD